jgi:hypothetical protein
MKKLIILIGIILFGINAQAQPATVCMPADVAKQVAQDLVIGDSAKALLNVAMEELDITRDKLSYKDSLILNSKLMEINLKTQLGNEQKQKVEIQSLYSNCKSQYAALAKKERKLRIKNKLKSGFGIPIIIALSVLYILK